LRLSADNPTTNHAGRSEQATAEQYEAAGLRGCCANRSAIDGEDQIRWCSAALRVIKREREASGCTRVIDRERSGNQTGGARLIDDVAKRSGTDSRHRQDHPVVVANLKAVTTRIEEDRSGNDEFNVVGG